MKRVLAISLIALGLSFSVVAQEHSPRSPNTPASAPPANTPPATPATDALGWVKFASDEGRFSVLVPEIPTDKTETKDSQHGPYTTHLFIVRDTNSVYLIGWVDYHPDFNFNRQVELEANRDNFVKGIGASLISSQASVIDGYSAIEFTAETVDRIFKSRVYMVGRRPYQIVIGTPKGVDESVKKNRFFESFKITKR